jgi:lysyl-tRNA synthetase class 2
VIAMPSSVIRGYRYDPAHSRLDIEFVSGEAYSYFDVPEVTVAGLKGAFSKGRYFQRHIRDRFDYRRDHKRRAFEV